MQDRVLPQNKSRLPGFREPPCLEGLAPTVRLMLGRTGGGVSIGKADRFPKAGAGRQDYGSCAACTAG